MNPVWKTVKKYLKEGILTTDDKGIIDIINESAEMSLRTSQHTLKGQPIYDFFEVYEITSEYSQTDILKPLFKSNNFKNLDVIEIIIKCKDSEIEVKGLLFPIHDDDYKFLGISIIFEETNEKIINEENIQHISRVESLGILAGKIAHNFNNILTAILGNISLAKFEAPESSEIGTYLNDAEFSIEKAKKLIKQLQTLSTEGNEEQERFSLLELLKKSVDLALSGSKVKSNYDIQDNLKDIVFLNKPKISLAFHNVILNSVEAMPEGGVLDIIVRNDDKTNGFENCNCTKNFITIRFRDYGVGIFEDDLPFVFESHFTTKFSEDGKSKAKGLGLTITKKIIDEIGGYICIDSEFGVGTIVSFLIPLFQ